jgi:NitT/TauT family transport system permease protein
MNRILQYATPVILGILVLAIWEFVVRHFDIPPYVLPAPLAIGAAFADNFSSLMASLWTTLQVTLEAFALAVAGGVALAILFSQNKAVENALYPYAVVLQVTPVVAIAPLILIWVGFEHINLALVIIAFIVAFFPILSNTTLGLRSTDRNLIDLFRLYGASRWQILAKLQLPSALPYLLGAMKISGGLALIGAVVAEFVAGSGTASGLAWRIVEAGNRLEIAKMFAALGLLAALGIVIFSILTLVEWALLHRWHESALKKEG